MYHLLVDHNGVTLALNETFWDDTITDATTGTTALDRNVAQVVQEIRAALYFVATEGPRH